MKFWSESALLCISLARMAAVGLGGSTVFHSKPAFLHHRKNISSNASGTDKVAASAISVADDSAAAEVVSGDMTETGAEVGALPAVSTMMGTAAETLKNINAQASILEARIAQAQMEREAKMARQRAVFEHRLLQQEQTNQDVIAANKHWSEEIADLKAGNMDIKKHSHELAETNRRMRVELRTIQSKLNRAGGFITASLKATDDSNAKKLAVLEIASQRTSDSDDGNEDTDDTSGTSADDVRLSKVSKTTKESDEDEDEDDADPKDGTSLLAVAAATRRTVVTASSSDTMLQLGQMANVEAELSGLRLAGPIPQTSANPNDELNVLSASVSQLRQQELAGEAKLRAMFLNSFKAGTKKYKELLQDQRGLNSTRASLQSMQSKLKHAEAHLESTRRNLEQRMRSVGLFLQRLSHVALASPREAPRLLDALPKEVALAAPVAA